MRSPDPRTDPPATLQLRVTTSHADRLLRYLLAWEASLVVLYLLVHNTLSLPWGPLYYLLDLDLETSLPTWFSALQLAAVAVVFAVAAARNARPDVLSGRWLVLASVGFTYLSADEAAMIHEQLAVYVARLGPDWIRLYQGERGGWLYLYGPAILVVALLALPVLLRLWRNLRRPAAWMFGGAAAYVVGALGVQILMFEVIEPWEARFPTTLAIAAEEFLEMAGVTLVLYGALLLALSLTPTPQPTERRDDAAAPPAGAARTP